jgi:hypothetical protein
METLTQNSAEPRNRLQKESVPPANVAYVAWRAGTSNKTVVVPARQVMGIDSWTPEKIYKFGLCLMLP